jgi:acyl-CoA thioester hydrolase
MGTWAAELSIDVRWGEMDALGHVNNIRYLAWLESSRIAFFEGLGLRTLPTETVGPLLARLEIDYLEPVVYPARITVGVRTEKIGNTSMTFLQDVWRAEAPERVVARSRTVVVLVNYATGAKVRVPDDVRRALGFPPG